MSTTVRALKLSGNPNGLGFLQQIGESFGTRPKASNKGEYFILGFLQQIGESVGIRPKAMGGGKI